MLGKESLVIGLGKVTSVIWPYFGFDDQQPIDRTAFELHINLSIAWYWQNTLLYQDVFFQFLLVYFEALFPGSPQ